MTIAVPLAACCACGSANPTRPTAASPAPPAVQRLFAASRDVVETFTVDASDGRLVPAARLAGFSPSGSMVTDPTGDRLYATTINGVEAFRVASDGSALTPLPGFRHPALTGISSLAFAPAGAVLYAQRPTEILALRVEAAGSLATIGATPVRASAGSLVIEPEGRYAYALLNPFRLLGFRIESTGMLTELPGSPYPLLDSGVNPTELRVGRAGGHLYFASQGDGVRPPNLQVYEFDPISGLPEPVVQYALPDGAQPRAFEVSRRGAACYLAYQDRSTSQIFVQAYAVDGATGRLGALGRVAVGPGIFAKLRLARDERSLFATLEPASAEPPVPPTRIAAVTLGPAGELGAVAGSLQTATSFTHSLIALGPQSR